MNLPYGINLLYQFADNVAFLLLAALGLMIILGVLDVINLAHGELIMLGAYITTLSYNEMHLPLPVCVLLSVIGVALFGLVLERTVIRRFYRDKLGALVATWGISLILSQGVLILFGPSLVSVPLPQWTVGYGGYAFGGYRLMLFGVAVLGAWLSGGVFFPPPPRGLAPATLPHPPMAPAPGAPPRPLSPFTLSPRSA